MATWAAEMNIYFFPDPNCYVEVHHGTFRCPLPASAPDLCCLPDRRVEGSVLSLGQFCDLAEETLTDAGNQANIPLTKTKKTKKKTQQI